MDTQFGDIDTTDCWLVYSFHKVKKGRNVAPPKQLLN